MKGGMVRGESVVVVVKSEAEGSVSLEGDVDLDLVELECRKGDP